MVPGGAFARTRCQLVKAPPGHYAIQLRGPPASDPRDGRRQYRSPIRLASSLVRYPAASVSIRAKPPATSSRQLSKTSRSRKGRQPRPDFPIHENRAVCATDSPALRLLLRGSARAKRQPVAHAPVACAGLDLGDFCGADLVARAAWVAAVAWSLGVVTGSCWGRIVKAIGGGFGWSALVARLSGCGGVLGGVVGLLGVRRLCASFARVVVDGGSRTWRLAVAAVGLGGDCGLVGGRGRWVSAWCCVLGVAVTLVVCAAPAWAATSHTAYVVNDRRAR